MTTNKAKVLRVLQRGGKYGTLELVTMAGIPDPHKAIARLIEDGASIASEWVKKTDGKRFKVWYLEAAPQQTTNTATP